MGQDHELVSCIPALDIKGRVRLGMAGHLGIGQGLVIAQPILSHPRENVIGGQVEHSLQAVDLGRSQVPLPEVDRGQAACHRRVVTELHSLGPGKLHQSRKGQHERGLVGSDHMHSG